MSLIQSPDSRYFDVKRRTSHLAFNGESKKLDGEYMMRGGVCWPVQVQTDEGPRLEGAAVLCGFHIETGRIIVFEETEFVCVDHVLDPATHVVEFRGVCDWLNLCWQQYYAQHYYYHHDAVTQKKHMLEVIRSRAINPKPVFLEAIWSDPAAADNLVWHKREINRLFFADRLVAHALSVMAVRPDAVLPVFQALRSALWGIDQRPFRAKGE